MSRVYIAYLKKEDHRVTIDRRGGFTYHIESKTCTQENHFRCNNHTCIYLNQVCDGKVNCKDGSDERGCVFKAKDVKAGLEQSISWLRREKDASFCWGMNTPRAITTLYLSGEYFRSSNMEQELMAKELELQMSLALLRNSTEHLSVNVLSNFINAFTVTCYNPRRLFGYDLLQILSDRLSMTSPIPGPYLTLCTSGWTIHENVTKNLLNLLQKESKYPFATDLQAMTVMALACIKNRTSHFLQIVNSTVVYNSTIQKFMDSQYSDGSFGSPQTTAWVTQALLASGQEINNNWNVSAAVNYLMQQLNSSVNFPLTYSSLPILNGKSLLDIGNINCAEVYGKDNDGELPHMLKGNLQIQYSLYIGDEKNVIHTMYLRMKDGSSALDVMKIAQLTDPKYRFLHKPVSGYEYVYEVAGMPNDPDAGMFWLLYEEFAGSNETVPINKSPERIIVQNEDHLIWWYKTSHI